MKSSLKVGYCTNVHAGINLDQILSNLRRHAVRARERSGLESLGIGLWFSETAAREVVRGHQVQRVKDELASMKLESFTLNGFPQGDFHSPVVKHGVYLPTWWQPERFEYTRLLIKILDELLEPGAIGSISTLPISWGNLAPDEGQWAASAQHFVQLARELNQQFEQTGRKIFIAIEPEPGCAITDSQSLRRFFADYLSPPRITSEEASLVRTYITMCHDICHAAVMFEDQREELKQCFKEGIGIGKVQVSSAIEVDWQTMDIEARRNALSYLGQFAEDRYLHQSSIMANDSGASRLIEDLPDALKYCAQDLDALGNETWRIHFHVPIFLKDFGELKSTRSEIDTYLKLVSSNAEIYAPKSGHFEIETYAWGVLPVDMQVQELGDGIGEEIRWFEEAIARNGLH